MLKASIIDMKRRSETRTSFAESLERLLGSCDLVGRAALNSAFTSLVEPSKITLNDRGAIADRGSSLLPRQRTFRYRLRKKLMRAYLTIQGMDAYLLQRHWIFDARNQVSDGTKVSQIVMVV